MCWEGPLNKHKVGGEQQEDNVVLKLETGTSAKLSLLFRHEVVQTPSTDM
jgi:hypothetical protein